MMRTILCGAAAVLLLSVSNPAAAQSAKSLVDGAGNKLFAHHHEREPAEVRVQRAHQNFGRYTVDEKEKVLTFHVQSATFANWNGQAQKRPFSV